MKKIILFLSLLICQHALAQKIVIEGGTKVLENGVQIAKVEKTSESYTVVTTLDEDDLFSIEELADEELLVNYYLVSFSDDNQSTAYLPIQKGKVNMVDLVLKARVLKNGALNAEAVKLFCDKYTQEAFKKKPQEKLNKEIAKEEKKLSKEEVEEEKEELLEEKKLEKVDKKQAKVEERQEKLDEKKEQLAEKKEQQIAKKEIHAIEETPTATEEIIVIKLDKGKIYKNDEEIGNYNALEGLINGKKGKTINVQNKAGVRVAIVKYQYNADKASLQNMVDKSKSELSIYSDNDAYIQQGLIEEVVKMGLVK